MAMTSSGVSHACQNGNAGVRVCGMQVFLQWSRARDVIMLQEQLDDGVNGRA